MKFYCDNCHAKYAIADEKVRGKILKVRCKTCEHVITVREPRAPAPEESAGSRPLPPRAPTRVVWHYAINGQSFGPFEEDKLCAMFEAGEVGDASYVWQASFGSEWKPARAIPQFSRAIDKGAALRPRNKTIGVSSALEAINVDNSIQDRDEEEGFVPGAEATPPEGMNQRIAGLREQLKKHDAPSPEAKRNPFGAKAPADGPVDGADSTTQMGRDEIAAALGVNSSLEEPPAEADDAPEVDQAGPTDPDPVSSPDLGEALCGEGEDDSDLGMSEGSEESDLFPSFGGMDAPDESVIDFSRLSAPSEANSDDAFAEVPLVVDKEIEKDGGDFKASNSLLIQLDSIQKQGRSKRVALGLVALVLVGGVGAVAAVAASNAEKKTEPKVNSVYEPQKKELVFKTYGKNELGLVFELDEGEEVLTADDRKEIIEEMKTGDDKNGGAKSVKPRVVAKNDNTGQKPDIDTQNPSIRGIGSGMSDLINREDKLGNALDTSKSADRNSESGLKTNSDDNTGAALKTKEADVKSKSGETDWDKVKAGGGSTPSALARIRERDQMNKANQDKPAGPRLGDDGVLSKDAAKAGFTKIKRSVASCHQRQVTRGLPLSSSKVHITVEIQGTGQVSDLKISPASFKHSEFETCMQDHRKRGRWKFEAYGGKTVKIKHTYVLQ
ncbi:MAG: GYF domain-containing protein [Myxococcota bacterium]|nr:GYF domain-containing protein [Myxococcota bacterium]